MKITIEQLDNGFLITEIDDFDPESREYKYVYYELKDVAEHVIDHYDPRNKRKEDNLYVVKAPGYDHEDFNEHHNIVIFGDEE